MEVTVGQLKKYLEAFNQDSPLFFGGLDFYRLKDRGGVVQIEFNQTVFKDDDGKIQVME